MQNVTDKAGERGTLAWRALPASCAGQARVAGLHTFPHYMNGAGYRSYLKETGKRELRRLGVSLPNPSGALLYLEGLLADK